jgi:heme oxygenase
MYLTVFPTDVLFYSAEKPRPRSSPMDLPQRLREAIAQDHTAIEELPLSKAILEARIDKRAYCELLSQLWYVHADLERLLTPAGELTGLVEKSMYRTHTLSHDLAALEMEVSAIQPATAQLLQEMREAAAESPWSLLGCVYVLEGSRMGSMVLVKPLSTALGIELRPGSGLDYHLEGIENRPRTWAKFKGQMQALELTPEETAHAIAGARILMEGLYAIYASFSPLANPTVA